MIHSVLKYAAVLLVVFSALQLTAQRHYHQPRIKVKKNHPYKTQTHQTPQTITDMHPTPIQLNNRKDSLASIQKMVELNNIPSIVHPKLRMSAPTKKIYKKQGYIGEIPVKQRRKKEVIVQHNINRTAKVSFRLNVHADLKKAHDFGLSAFFIILIIIFGLILLLGVVGIVFVILSLASVLSMASFLGIGLAFTAIGIIAAVLLGAYLFRN